MLLFKLLSLFTLVSFCLADIDLLLDKIFDLTKDKKVIASQITKKPVIKSLLGPLDIIDNLFSRDETVSSTLSNRVNAFLLNLKIGSALNQSFDCLLDTGSADLWVPNQQFCDQAKSCPGPGYDPSQSTTSNDTGYNFTINYVGSQGYKGKIYNDTVEIGGYKLNNSNFAEVYTGGSTLPIIGVGYPDLRDKPPYYRNIPQKMVDEGYINNFGYGIYLDQMSSTSGLIVFGGYFTNGYVGKYYQLPILDKGSVSSVLSSLLVNFDNSNFQDAWILQTPVRALFDTGSTALILPVALYNKTMDLLQVTIDPEHGPVYECSNFNHTNSVFSLNFLGVNITAPINTVATQINNTHCHPSISSINADYIILGEFFLRSTTLYFDLDNQLINIAQAKLGESHEDMLSKVEEYPKDGANFDKAPNFYQTQYYKPPTGTAVTFISTTTTTASANGLFNWPFRLNTASALSVPTNIVGQTLKPRSDKKVLVKSSFLQLLQQHKEIFPLVQKEMESNSEEVFEILSHLMEQNREHISEEPIRLLHYVQGVINKRDTLVPSALIHYVHSRE